MYNNSSSKTRGFNSIMEKIKLVNKYAIGVHVMWFEIEMLEGYMDALINALETVENPKSSINLDFCFNLTQAIETMDESKITPYELLDKFDEQIAQAADLSDMLVYEWAGYSKGGWSRLPAQMKNWLPALLGSFALAIDRIPFWCFRELNSAGIDQVVESLSSPTPKYFAAFI